MDITCLSKGLLQIWARQEETSHIRLGGLVTQTLIALRMWCRQESIGDGEPRVYGHILLLTIHEGYKSRVWHPYIGHWKKLSRICGWWSSRDSRILVFSDTEKMVNRGGGVYRHILVSTKHEGYRTRIWHPYIGHWDKCIWNLRPVTCHSDSRFLVFSGQAWGQDSWFSGAGGLKPHSLMNQQ